MSKIAFDIDGVLYPWTTASVQAANTRGYNIDDDPDAHTQWNWLPEQISKEDWAWLWQGAGLQLMFDRPELVYPGTDRMLRHAAAENSLRFVTHRPSAASGYTARWLAERRVPFHSLHVLGHTPKSAVIGDADIFIDDKTDNVAEVLLNHPTVKVGAPRRPWNTDLEGTPPGCTPGDPRWLGLYDDMEEVLEWARR